MPKKSKLENILANLMAWEEQVRPYEQRKDKNGVRQIIPDDVRMSSIESLVPEELERHLLLNAQRLSDYVMMREEVVMYAGARTGQTYRAGASQKQKDPRAMDLDAFDKGKKGKYIGAKARARTARALAART
jgi:hypothetical protein